MRYNLRYIAAGASLLVLAGCASMGGSGNTQSTSPTPESKLALNAKQLLENQMALPDKKRIPQDLISDAKCIAVFPKIVQGGFIVAAHHGTGLVSCQQGQNGWDQAAPAVYSLSGGSVGLQAGAKKSSVILLFQTRDSMNNLLKRNITLGTQLGVTAGPIGFNANVSTAPAPVVAYVTSKTGLFAGVSLNGSKMSYKQKANSQVYSQSVQGPRSILLHTNQIPPSMQPFNQTLQTFVQPNM